MAPQLDHPVFLPIPQAPPAPAGFFMLGLWRIHVDPGGGRPPPPFLSAILPPCCTCSYPGTGSPAIGHGGGSGTPVEGGKMRGMETKLVNIPVSVAFASLTAEQRDGVGDFIKELLKEGIAAAALPQVFYELGTHHPGEVTMPVPKYTDAVEQAQAILKSRRDATEEPNVSC